MQIPIRLFFKVVTLAYLCFYLISHNPLYAQMRVGQPSGSPDGSAALEVSGGPYSSGSAYRGIVPPKVALTQTTQAAPITAPATGLLIYNTAKVGDVTPGYYYWEGSKWARLSTTSSAGAGRVATAAGDPIPAYTMSQSLTLTTPPDIIYIVDEGREGMFRYVSGSTTTADGAMTLSTTGGRYKRIIDGHGINVRWFGAKGDGTTDDTQAIQAAINSNMGSSKSVVLIPAGKYVITSTINCTDKNGIYLSGAGGRYVNSEIIANTGGIAIDFSGSTLSGCEKLLITSPNGLSNPSTIGLQFALNKEAPNQSTPGKQKGGLNCSISDVTIFMGDYVGANNGLGSIGIVNCRSEEFSLHNVFIRANTGCVFTTQLNMQPLTGYAYTVSSQYTPLQDDAIGSMGVTNWSGQNSIQCWEYQTPALLLNGVNTFNYHGYIGRLNNTTNGNYQTAIRCVNYTFGLNIHATIESYGQIMSIQNTLENANLNITTANQANATVPVFLLDQYAKIKGSRVNVGFGNGVSEMQNRHFLYTEPVNNGNSPTNASLINSEFTCSDFPSNPKFVAGNLLLNSANCKFNSGQPFEKIGPYISDTKTYDKAIAVVNTNHLSTGQLVRFTLADQTTKTVNNAGYYQAHIYGNIKLGQYATNNGPCVATFESIITLIQNVDGTYAPQSTKTVIHAKSAVNPSYLDITNISASFVMTSTEGSINLTVTTAGTTVPEGVHFLGSIRLQSDFRVNQSVIYD